MDLERWQRLSPLLDALFELEPSERERHLAELRGADPTLAAELEALISLEHGSEDFLLEPVVSMAPSARSGAMVGPYRLELLLGEGGMGQVWQAARADGLYQRRVALKLLRPGLADPNLRLRFTRERQILARLEHPHIARLLDAGISNDSQPYLALEYVEGEPITDYCRNRSVPLESRLALFQQVCEAVSHAHANLIVHRDLKPSNIMVTPGGEVRLLDFGIAKLLDTENKTIERTRTGVRAFTLHYAAPEQVRGEPVTTMTDVYSLGVVLYELLADAKPYRLKRQTDAEWEEAILAHDPQRPSQAVLRNTETATAHDAAGMRRRARALSGDLDNITLKALAKRPEQRYPSVEALSLDLQRHQAGRPVQARAQGMGYRVRKYVHRHRWALATGVVVAAVLLGALAIVAWQAREAVREAARAQAMQDFVIGLFENAGIAAAGQPLNVEALLKAAEEHGGRGLARQPSARAELLGVIARIHISLGNYKQALAVLQRQATMIAALPEAPSGLRLQAATQTGRAQRLLGESRDCIATMQPMLDDARREQVQLASQVSDFYSQLGRCRRAIGEGRTARALFERSMALRGDPLGDDVGVVENMADLAALHSDVGQSREALQAFRDALAQLRAAGGEKHPLAVDILRSIGVLQRELGDPDAAEKTFAEAIALATQQLGMQHPSTLSVRRQLAGVYLDRGRLADAEREFRTVQRLLVARLGPDHPDVAGTWSSIGVVLWERDRVPAALDALRQAIRIWRQPGGAGLLPGGLFNYAMVLHADGSDAEALQALEEARRMRVSQFGAQHSLVGDTDRLIGECLAALGRDVEARLRLNQAVNLLHSGEDRNSVRTLRAELALARLQTRIGELPDAIPQFERIEALTNPSTEYRKLRWRARAYAAEAKCRNNDAVGGRGALDALLQELATALPEGGALPRETAAIRAACP
ncbi:serine/threonine-protein kinase [Luteimonas sp. SX5]|uniref:Serine/threonine-protein kinase n=1 Tax=Luteimonas galliterrae TaxID=2940486 RepID=A0ABT0MJN0_9GAMM|nr:serine/threonine-protein kinase [Luteimonas galliterrae]MCL1635082.1 serine/threonine-protein kinase [Luteimonas galliterrae]